MVAPAQLELAVGLYDFASGERLPTTAGQEAATLAVLPLQPIPGEFPNATAVKIARGELSAICHAVGVMQPRDSVELHNLPLVIQVRVKKRTDTGELVNEIKAFTQREPSAPVAAAAPASNGAPPWKRA